MKIFKKIADSFNGLPITDDEIKHMVISWSVVILLVVSLFFNLQQSFTNSTLSGTNKALVKHNAKLNKDINIATEKYHEQLREVQQLKFKQHTIVKIEKYIKFFRIPLEEEYLRQISTAFYVAGKKYHIDYKTLISVAWHENRFNYNNTSSAGALGIMQIMPLWLRDKEFKKATNINNVEDMIIPERNILAGAYIYNKYRQRLMKKGFDWDVVENLTLLAYNRGITNVMSDIKKGRDPENGYASVVIKQATKLKKHF